MARADLMGEITVLTKHNRPAAAIVPAGAVAVIAEGQAAISGLWQLLDQVCPLGQGESVDEARARRGDAAAAGGVGR